MGQDDPGLLIEGWLGPLVPLGPHSVGYLTSLSLEFRVSSLIKMASKPRDNRTGINGTCDCLHARCSCQPGRQSILPTPTSSGTETFENSAAASSPRQCFSPSFALLNIDFLLHY